MINNLTLDQLMTFVAAADEGSFSAAGRRLSRAQSAVSHTLANLERQLGVQLFDRSTRIPKLTEGGRALLADARQAVADVDLLKTHARTLAGGIEPELAVVVDVMFPMDLLTAVVAKFQRRFPTTSLRFFVEALGAVVQPVIDGRCSIGIIGSLPLVPPQLRAERLLGVPMVHVASSVHPLAAIAAPIPERELAKHVQLVLTDRSPLSEGREFGVLSPRTWRLADLGAKLAFIRAGLGWGSMPLELVRDDLRSGALQELRVENSPPRRFMIEMSAVYRLDIPPGPAGRWFADQLKESVSTTSPSLSDQP